MKIYHFTALLVLTLTFSGSCASNSPQAQKGPELDKRLNLANELLDRINKGDILLSCASDICVERDSTQRSAAYLIENPDIALPLMFERLKNKRVPQEASRVYFLVFEKTKSIESIPYIADYIASASEEEAKACGEVLGDTLGVNLTYALFAAGNIMYPPPNSPYADVSTPKFVDSKRTLYDQRLDIANKLRQWYKEHKAQPK